MRMIAGRRRWRRDVGLRILLTTADDCVYFLWISLVLLSGLSSAGVWRSKCNGGSLSGWPCSSAGLASSNC